MEITGATIVSTSQVKPEDKVYTVFLIEVRCTAGGREEFKVATFRRYSEFRRLDKKITAKFPHCRPFPFPPKRSFGNTSPDFVALRSAQLQHYLDTVLQNPRIAADRLVVSFLCPIVERTLAKAHPGVGPLLKDSIRFVVGANAPLVTRASARTLQRSAFGPRASVRMSRLPPNSGVLDLPESMLVVVFSFLGYRDLLNASLVCRTFYVVSSHNALWQRALDAVTPEWPSAAPRQLNPMSSRLACGAKREFLRMSSFCTPRRRAFQQPSQFVICASCQLRKALGVLVGPSALQLGNAVSAGFGPLPSDLPNDPSLRAGYGICRVHAQARRSLVCFHVHAEGASAAAGVNSAAAAARFFLLRSNFAAVCFFADDPSTLGGARDAMAKVRYDCPRIPVFLVGIPSWPGANVTESRQTAMDSAAAMGALKYIELSDITAAACGQMLSEIGAVLSVTLSDPPIGTALEGTPEDPNATVMGPDDQDEDECGLSGGDSEAGYFPATSSKASSLILSNARWQSAQRHRPEDPSCRRLAKAVLRGARQHFIIQLQQFAVDTALRDFVRSGLPIEPQSLAVKSFLSNMTAYVHGSSLWAGASETELRRVAREIEEYVFERLYRVLFRPPQDTEADAALEKRIGRLSFVLPSHLEIPKQYWDYDAWQAAVEELLGLNYAVSPFAKMWCVMNCSKILLNILHSRCKVHDTSADHFLPHLVYVLLKANPPFLASNIAFVSRFCDEASKYTEAYYYWTSLEVAVGFIQQLNERSLHISHDDYERLTSDEIVPCKINPLSIKRYAAKAYKVFGIDPSGDKLSRTLGDDGARAASASASSDARRWKSAQLRKQTRQYANQARGGSAQAIPSQLRPQAPPAVPAEGSRLPASPMLSTSFVAMESPDLDDDDGAEIDRERRRRISKMLPDLMLDPHQVAILSSTPPSVMKRLTHSRTCLTLDDSDVASQARPTAGRAREEGMELAAIERRSSIGRSMSTTVPDAALQEALLATSLITSPVKTRPRGVTPLLPPQPSWSPPSAATSPKPVPAPGNATAPAAVSLSPPPPPSSSPGRSGSGSSGSSGNSTPEMRSKVGGNKQWYRAGVSIPSLSNGSGGAVGAVSSASSLSLSHTPASPPAMWDLSLDDVDLPPSVSPR